MRGCVRISGCWCERVCCERVSCEKLRWYEMVCFERDCYVMLWVVSSLVFGARVDRQDPVPHDHFSDGLCGAIH